MNCKEIVELLPECIEESLEVEVKEIVVSHLKNCANCRNEFEKLKSIERILNKAKDEEVPPLVDYNIKIMLENEKRAAKLSLSNKLNQKHISLSTLLKVAAGILLLVTGGFIGYFIRPAENSSVEVTSLKQEMVEMKNLVIYSLLKQESASERIKAVSYIKEISKPDPKLIETLFNTLNTDRNVNVRLAAAQALAKYKDNKVVAIGIVKSLETQTEPLVQIMLINLAVETGNSDVAPELNKLLDRTDLRDEVKTYAKKGIKTLSI